MAALVRTTLCRTVAARRCGQSLTTSASQTLLDVQEYYGKVLESSKDLKTNACTTADRPPQVVVDALSRVPQQIKDKYYGCGVSVPAGIKGLDVLDLGSGSGQDCYIAAALVGPSGSVIGIDMTDEQLSLAREHAETYTTETLGYPECNLGFQKGYIESIEAAGISKESIDLCVSNCVVNLSPDKPSVIAGVYDALREGGEFFFSDVYADRRIPQHVREHKVLWGECLAGALYIEDFLRIAQKVGFTDPREVKRAPIEVHDPELVDLLGPVNFYSITYRCFKLPSLETLCENYGQVAYYNGSIDGHRHTYTLDADHVFEKNVPHLVCGNTASMLEETWLKPHFRVVGDRSVHYGLFPCGEVSPTTPVSDGAPASSGGGCC